MRGSILVGVNGSAGALIAAEKAEIEESTSVFLTSTTQMWFRTLWCARRTWWNRGYGRPCKARSSSSEKRSPSRLPPRGPQRDASRPRAVAVRRAQQYDRHGMIGVTSFSEGLLGSLQQAAAYSFWGVRADRTGVHGCVRHRRYRRPAEIPTRPILGCRGRTQ